jgi:hypothetical protein
MKEHFHPKDRSAKAMFYRAHDKIMEKLHAFAEIQAGPNPLSDDERRRLADKYPERYGFMRPRKRQETR